MLVAANEKRTDELSFVLEVNMNFDYRNILHRIRMWCLFHCISSNSDCLQITSKGDLKNPVGKITKNSLSYI